MKLNSKFAMVFLHFPSSLTEEEQMLQRKYAQLRKKKKQLAAIKNSTEEASCRNVTLTLLPKFKLKFITKSCYRL